MVGLYVKIDKERKQIGMPRLSEESYNVSKEGKSITDLEDFTFLISNNLLFKKDK